MYETIQRCTKPFKDVQKIPIKGNAKDVSNLQQENLNCGLREVGNLYTNKKARKIEKSRISLDGFDLLLKM